MHAAPPVCAHDRADTQPEALPRGGGGRTGSHQGLPAEGGAQHYHHSHLCAEKLTGHGFPTAAQSGLISWLLNRSMPQDNLQGSILEKADLDCKYGAFQIFRRREFLPAGDPPLL